MKIHHRFRYFLSPRLADAFPPLLAAAILLLLSPTARAETDADIGVRSKVMDKDLQWAHKTASLEDGGHSRTYAIVAIDEVKSECRLVKPVNQENILEQLYEQLLANGFTKYAKGTKPDILLAVSYGRGEMSNPYLRGQVEITLSPTGVSDGVPFVYLSGAVAVGQSVIDHKTPGFEAGLQKAGFEKLFIRITAFAYPTNPKARPKMLWKTIIVADDPDHRDLNKIAAEMLKAGAPYFDKDLKNQRPEIEFWHGVPKGEVNVGTPTVVQSDVKK